MKTSIRRRITAVVGAGALALALASCASGFDAQTYDQEAFSAGVSGQANGMEVQDAMVVVNEDSGIANIPASFFNRTDADDALLGVSFGTAQPHEAGFLHDGLTRDLVVSAGVPAQNSVTIGNPSVNRAKWAMADGGDVAEGDLSRRTIFFQANGWDIPLSHFTPVTFEFENAGPITLDLEVVSDDGLYAAAAPILPVQVVDGDDEIDSGDVEIMPFEDEDDA